MKIKLSIKRQIQVQPDDLQEKINNYLKKNYYRVTERGEGFIIFIDDEYSDRKRFRSDYHTRIGEGKFEFHSSGQMTVVRLIYLTPVLYPIFLIMSFTAVGIFINSFMPIFFSFAFSLPVLYKIHYLNEHVFNEILED